MVREYQPDDFEAVAKLNKDCYKRPSSDAALRESILSGAAWVYQDLDLIVACVVTTIQDGQPYIWSITTDRCWRRKGLAKLLIEEAVRHYKSKRYRRITLDVDSDNPAQKLYFDCGFRINHVEKEFYGPVSHGLGMVRRFF